MSFIREVKRGDNIYLAEVRNKRVGKKVVQEHIRYIGKKAEGKTILSCSISDVAVDSVKIFGPLPKELRLQIEADFEEIHNRLRYIENLYNPHKLNLHFDDLPRADAELYRELLVLSREGFEKVKHHGEYFTSHPLYADGMFWYELFLLINSAALRVMKEGSQTDIPQEVVNKLIENLIEITAYSTVNLGDIAKRNYESLGNTLIAFFSKELLELVNRRMRTISSKSAKELINRSIKSTKELVKKESRG